MHLALALMNLGALSPEIAAEAPKPATAGLEAAPAARMPKPAASEELSPILGSSLEDLLQTEVTSVARKSQRLADVAAAVFVITADDIARSGAHSIPEVLRLAPGVDAVRISGDRWAVSIRGFTDRFANKLLVLVDGRNAYNPAFSGQFWETLQLPLGEIQRIEVVRGPGASVWGTNAVNGVINIITKAAAATHGAELLAGGGNREGAFAEARYGNRIDGSDTHYRVYAKGQQGNSFEHPDGSDAHDAYRNATGGFRIDSYGKEGSSWNLSGEAFEVVNRGEFLVPEAPPRFISVAQQNEHFDGGNLRGRYTRRVDNGSELEAQLAYAYSHSQLGVLGSDQRNTVDIDLQHHLHFSAGQEFSWGGGYRYSADSEGAGLQQRLKIPKETLQVYSLFGQGELNLASSLRGTLGVRLDHNQYTGLEWQPTARLLWNMDESSSAWLSASRAVRTPSRGERSFTYTAAYAAPGLPVTIEGSEQFGAEHLLAYEIGMRRQLTPRLFADATAYYHQYKDLRATDPTPALARSLKNAGRLSLYGEETSLDWRLSRQWHVQASYAYAQPQGVSGNTSEGIGIVKHIAALQAGWAGSHGLSVDSFLRYHSRRNVPPELASLATPAFTTLDLSIRWALDEHLELLLVGQDLLEARHAEFRTQAPMIVPTDVERGGYASVKYQF